MRPDLNDGIVPRMLQLLCSYREADGEPVCNFALGIHGPHLHISKIYMYAGIGKAAPLALLVALIGLRIEQVIRYLVHCKKLGVPPMQQLSTY